MWEDWQEIVRRSLPNFAASPIYVQQRSQSQDEFERAAEECAALANNYDPYGKVRDEEFGALVRTTKAMGRITRMWIDSNIEIDFVTRHVGCDFRMLDIGAGYGRLAVPMSTFAKAYYCVDPVPISVEICTGYCARFAPDVQVLPVAELLSEAPTMKIDMAINIHSWNECSIAQIRRWLSVLDELRVPLLFTVSNGQISGGRSAYSSWGGRGESWRPLLEAQYELIAEEGIGLSHHPHALWRLR